MAVSVVVQLDIVRAQSVPSLQEFIESFLIICDGIGTRNAPVPPVSVPASISAVVAISTFPAVVVSAFTTDPLAKLVQAHPIYCCNIPSAVLYITIPLDGTVIAASRAVASA